MGRALMWRAEGGSSRLPRSQPVTCRTSQSRHVQTMPAAATSRACTHNHGGPTPGAATRRAVPPSAVAHRGKGVGAPLSSIVVQAVGAVLHAHLEVGASGQPRGAHHGCNQGAWMRGEGAKLGAAQAAQLTRHGGGGQHGLEHGIQQRARRCCAHTRSTGTVRDNGHDDDRAHQAAELEAFRRAVRVHSRSVHGRARQRWVEVIHHVGLNGGGGRMPSRPRPATASSGGGRRRHAGGSTPVAATFRCITRHSSEHHAARSADQGIKRRPPCTQRKGRRDRARCPKLRRSPKRLEVQATLQARPA